MDRIGTFPPQAWMSRQGRVDLRPLAPADWSAEAIAARAQIAEAFYRFGIGHDECRDDVAASCFTEDVTYEVSLGTAEPFTRFTGRETVRERLAAIFAEMTDQRRHLIGNVVLEDLDLAAGTARALAFGVVTVAADGLIVGASVFYVASARREADDCWRFSHFLIGMDDFAGRRPKAGESPAVTP